MIRSLVLPIAFVALAASCAPLLAQPEPVVIAADPVGKVHTAGLQVLCAFIRDRRQAGLATRLEPCADSLKDAAGRLGLSAELGIA